ncbi:NrdR family transcriptional regulator [Methylorubrum thiocyanatum]
MICPKCDADDDLVIESRKSPLGIRRRRDCQCCGHRWTTVEVNRSDLIGIGLREFERAVRNIDDRAVAVNPLP